MREVPAPFFQEAFDLDQQQLWEEVVEVIGRSLCSHMPASLHLAAVFGGHRGSTQPLLSTLSPHATNAITADLAHALAALQVKSEEARQESLQRLSTYLDIVETHLVREIAARTGELFTSTCGFMLHHAYTLRLGIPH